MYWQARIILQIFAFCLHLILSSVFGHFARYIQCFASSQALRWEDRGLFLYPCAFQVVMLCFGPHLYYYHVNLCMCSLFPRPGDQNKTLPKCGPKKSARGEFNSLTVLGMDAVSGKQQPFPIPCLKQMKVLTNTVKECFHSSTPHFYRYKDNLRTLWICHREEKYVSTCADTQVFVWIWEKWLYANKYSLLFDSFHSHRKPGTGLVNRPEQANTAISLQCVPMLGFMFAVVVWCVLSCAAVEQWCRVAVVLLRCMAWTRRCTTPFWVS